MRPGKGARGRASPRVVALVYHWAVDFLENDDEDTEPVEVKDGTETTFEAAFSKAKHTAHMHNQKRAAKMRKALIKERERRERGGWNLGS